MSELEKWCQDHDITANCFEEIFEGKDIPPDWANEVYNLGRKSMNPEIMTLQSQIKGLQTVLQNIGTHLHLETKKRWWQRK